MRRALVGFLLLVALFTEACGASASGLSGASVSATAPAVESTASAGAPVPSQAGAASAAPAATHARPQASPAPKPTPTPAPTAEAPSASAAPSNDSSASESASPSASASTAPSPTDAAGLCQPEGSNPNFWPGIARAVGWDVYCAVLPKGWSVASGSYRLADGGKLVISYKGPNGATLTLSEGSFCADDSGCVPAGSEVGRAAFGPLDGTLVASDGGGYSIVADRGQSPSWLMTTTGLDQATTTALGSALAHVGS